MVEFNVFDSILDIIFVIDGDGRVVYCNDAAATFCATSVRRVAGKAMLADIISFAEPGLLPFNESSQGRHSPTPFIETAFEVRKSAKTGKVQLSMRPIGDGKHWGLFIKDVSLEETLANKYRAELVKTEEYARNLEKLVAERTAELRSVNQTLNAILNSLGQGFFTFNAAGDCGRVFTKACEDVLEGTPTGRKAWDVLAVAQDGLPQFQKWSESLFREYLPFEDLKGLGPGLFPHSKHKHVVLDYFPIRRDRDAIEEIVVVATDKTTEHQAQLALESERQYAAMIVKFIKNKDQFIQFLSSVKQSLQRLQSLVAVSSDFMPNIAESFRILHTLEGEAGTFSLRDLRQSSRVCQQALEECKGVGGPSEASCRKYKSALDEMAKRFATFLDENQNTFGMPDDSGSRTTEIPLDSVNLFLQELRRAPGAAALARHYQDLFLRVGVEGRLKYFDGLVQNVAERLGKKVKPLAIEDGGVRIFPEPYERLFSSMVHAFRNAIDHGLEMPDEREWAGKDPAGQIRVCVSSADRKLSISISDDGKGIDPAIIRRKLIDKFPDRDFSKESDDQIIQNVALPGFSSRDEVGEFSGRGVGLDALREEVLRLGGTLHLKSKVGEGTTIEIQVPELGHETAMLRSA